MDKIIGPGEQRRQEAEDQRTGQHQQVHPRALPELIKETDPAKVTCFPDHPGEKRREKHIIYKEIEDEPEMVPAEVTRRVGLEPENSQIEIPIVPGIPLGNPFQVHLWRNHYEDTGQEGNEQPLEP